jgi:hypothetical protein
MEISHRKRPWRSFTQYIKDNWAVIPPFIAGLGFAPIAFADGVLFIGYFCLFVSTVCVGLSYVDWRRNG